MSTSNLKRFSIHNLFQERDVSLDFDDNCRVLVAENGHGKTSILNALYHTIRGDSIKLGKIDFQWIEIEFDDGEKFRIFRKELDLANAFKDKAFYDHLCILVGKEETHRLVEAYFDHANQSNRLKVNPYFKLAQKKTGFPSETLVAFLKQHLGPGSDEESGVKTKIKFSRIKAKFPYTLLYLPTYRRVEVDLSIGEGEDGNGTRESIYFGMRDVEELIKARTQEILSSSVEWFSKVNGQMLSQLVEGFSLDQDLKESIKKPGDVKIVLDRIGNNIDGETKERILELIESDAIFIDHDPLIFFISNLVKVYEQQRENDQALQSFTEVCNRYLGDKMIKYNEGSVALEVVRRKNQRTVGWDVLSSGEKQIISLFAKLYLQKQNSFAIFFDEPELSLSMEWQKTLLPDILGSGKCAFLLATTHSPFIFENNLLPYTVDLSHYIKEL
ncbi:AAA family ATPase [Pseudomonas monteilii]|uniref:AAA family ATPase n=1 Tax=Pseudomonas monteilii TaxID=76759 RepID=UPI003F6E2610